MASVMAVVDIHNINAKPSRQSEARTTPATACLCRLIKPHLNARCKTSDQYSSMQRDSVPARAPRLLAPSEKTYQS
jgi:hypothetical protein